MSGYRTLHREVYLDADEADEADVTGSQSEPFPLWAVKFSPCRQSKMVSAATSPLRLLTASADGMIHAYELADKLASGAGGSALDASAVKMRKTSVLLGKDQDFPVKNSIALGCAAFDLCRNYGGSDPQTGDEIVVGVELDGTVRVWCRDEQPSTVDSMADDPGGEDPKLVRAEVEFQVAGATGTTCAIRPPSLGPAHGSHSWMKVRPVLVAALGCLDGSVAIVSTGVALHLRSNDAETLDAESQPLAAEGGKVCDRLGTGSAVPTSLAWSPSSDTIAIGRKDGTVSIYNIGANDLAEGTGSYKRIHQIMFHHQPVRGLAFTSDAALLIVGDDEGTLTIHDVVQPRPSTVMGMVGSVVNAHMSYILSLSALTDGKRFVTSGADGLVQVWDVGMINSGPVHTFADSRGTGMVWGSSTSVDGMRLASAHDNGMLAVYSSDE